MAFFVLEIFGSTAFFQLQKLQKIQKKLLEVEFPASHPLTRTLFLDEFQGQNRRSTGLCLSDGAQTTPRAPISHPRPQK
jgi:hypothetical protein